MNTVQQDTAVSAYGQYNYSTGALNVIQVVEEWGSALTAATDKILNMGYNSATNTFTINHTGTYRINYSVCIINKDSDGTSIQVVMKRNESVFDDFYLASRTRILGQLNRITTMNNTFIFDLLENDTVRLWLKAENFNGGFLTTENVQLLDFHVSLERIRINL